KRKNSIFRRLLGDAFLGCRRHKELRRQWQDPNGSDIAEVEAQVSRLLSENFCFAFVAVEDGTERRDLEAWLIGSLAGNTWAPPSPSWLGHHSSWPKVRTSGLWNNQGVSRDAAGRDNRRMLERFSELVEATVEAWSGPPRTGEKRSTDVLLILPCSAGKRPAPSPLLPGPGRSILSNLAHTAEALRQVRAGKAHTVCRNSPARAALDYYDGLLYREPGLRDRLAGLIRSGEAEVLILSGGYGAVLADEPIHNYEAPMDVRYWRRHGLPEALTEFMAQGRPVEPVIDELPERHAQGTGHDPLGAAAPVLHRPQRRFFYPAGQAEPGDRSGDRGVAGGAGGEGMHTPEPAAHGRVLNGCRIVGEDLLG
ncbi:MAG TPA: hypothetical protein VF282_02680, partial [Bacillota bacterium]